METKQRNYFPGRGTVNASASFHAPTVKTTIYIAAVTGWDGQKKKGEIPKQDSEQSAPLGVTDHIHKQRGSLGILAEYKTKKNGVYMYIYVPSGADPSLLCLLLSVSRTPPLLFPGGFVLVLGCGLKRRHESGHMPSDDAVDLVVGDPVPAKNRFHQVVGVVVRTGIYG